MLFMASEGLSLPVVARHFPNNVIWQFVGYQTNHVEWRGCALWDLIQPSFMFMVGVAVAFSIASRRAKEQTFKQMFRHALLRSVILMLPGPLLAYLIGQTHVTFEDVLTQIGLGYTFLFLVAWLRPKAQFGVALALLVGYWAAFALYSLSPAGFDYQSVGVPADWHHLSGFAAHWDKNTNLAAAFDQWFLNLFPTSKPFVFDEWGYQTLNFVPSLATMIFGLLAGEWLRRPTSPGRKAGGLAATGTVALLVGVVLDQTGICPCVKKIWTPGWAIFSAGWASLFLSALYSVIDWRGHRRWTFPFMIVGMNSIVMYGMAGLLAPMILWGLKQFPGDKPFSIFGLPYTPLVEGILVLAVLWLICLFLHRRKIFIKI